MEKKLASLAPPSRSGPRGQNQGHTKAPSTQSTSTFSFLFVIHKLEETEAYRHSTNPPSRDDWGNLLPPRQADEFGNGQTSLVMKYHDDQVEVTDDWIWDRRPPNTGCCRGGGYLHSRLNPMEAKQYSVKTVFEGSPHLPYIIIDGDASIIQLRSNEGEPGRPHMDPLYFFRPSNPPYVGISMVGNEKSEMTLPAPGMDKYVAGKNPSWKPILVPETYQNPLPDAPTSQGLGGEVAIVLALLAFGGLSWAVPWQEDVDNVFVQHSLGWRGAWREKTRKMPLNDSPPRGILVAVYYDEDNPSGSTDEAFRQFQWRGPIIED